MTPRMIVTMLSQLLDQLDSAGTVAVPQIVERLEPAGGVGGDRAQQIAQLMRGAGAEAAIGTARQPGDLAIGLLGDLIVAFLEQERGNAEQTEFARLGTQLV